MTLYWIITFVVAFIIIGNFGNKKQSSDWRIRAFLSFLWFSLAFISGFLDKNYELMRPFGIILGMMNAAIAYMRWQEKNDKAGKGGQNK